MSNTFHATFDYSGTVLPQNQRGHSRWAIIRVASRIRHMTCFILVNTIANACAHVHSPRPRANAHVQRCCPAPTERNEPWGQQRTIKQGQFSMNGAGQRPLQHVVRKHRSFINHLLLMAYPSYKSTCTLLTL